METSREQLLARTNALMGRIDRVTEPPFVLPVAAPGVNEDECTDDDCPCLEEPRPDSIDINLARPPRSAYETWNYLTYWEPGEINPCQVGFTGVSVVLDRCWGTNADLPSYPCDSYVDPEGFGLCWSCRKKMLDLPVNVAPEGREKVSPRAPRDGIVAHTIRALEEQIALMTQGEQS